MILETFSNLNDYMTQILDSHWGTSTCSEHWIGYTSALLWLLVLWETPIRKLLENLAYRGLKSMWRCLMPCL